MVVSATIATPFLVSVPVLRAVTRKDSVSPSTSASLAAAMRSA